MECDRSTSLFCNANYKFLLLFTEYQLSSKCRSSFREDKRKKFINISESFFDPFMYKIMDKKVFIGNLF